MKTLLKIFLTGATCVALACSLLAAKDSPPKGYKSLIKGESLDEWLVIPEKTQQIWKVDPKDGSLGRSIKNGTIWHKKTYGDFDLQLEFKMSRNCNSGVFFRSDPNNPVQGGFEIQIYDTKPNMPLDKHAIGALYDSQPASANTLNQTGKWNTFRLKVKGDRVQVWINGKLVNDADLSKWTTAEKNPDGTKNKFKTALNDLPKSGHIGFQDHGHNVWFRKIYIKEL
ncbi:MAG: DUF1080 domain-containing protein [Puniceicoccaceae bacterium]